MGRPALVDPGGVAWAVYPELPRVYGKSFARRDWYRRVSRGWEPYVSEVFQGARDGALAVVLAGPVRDLDGSLIVAGAAGLALTGALVVLSVLALRSHRREVAVLAALEDRTRALEASETKFRSVTQSAVDAIVYGDSEGRIISWNSGAEASFGYRADEVLGRPLTLLMPAGYREAYRQGLERSRATSASHVVGRAIELHGLRKNGEEFPVELTLSAWKSGEATFYTSIIRDVTERKRSEEALREAQEELARKERLAFLGQLAGGVSHELRNPLGVIRNSVYYLRMVLPDDDRVQNHLAILEREVRAANRIVTDLLDFARIKSPQRELTDLGPLVREAVARAPLNGTVMVDLTLAEDVPPVALDPAQLLQILQNLITNALQAMPTGGTLTVATARADGGVLVSVADTGVGISPENLPKIFQPLFSTKAKGIGLGLAVAKSLAEANGAGISVVSAPQQGSRFVVRFALPEAER